MLLELLGASALAQTSTPVTIRIGTTLSDSFAQAYYAVDGGFLNRVGIDGRLSVFGGSGAVSTAVAAGAVDLGLCDAIAIANGLIRNLPFVAIAGSGLFTAAVPTGLLCVDSSSPLKAPKELEGKSISVPSLNSLTTLAIQAWLSQSGADPNSVKFIELPFPEVTAALNRGTVAAGYVGEPLLESALKATARRFGNPYAALGKQVLVSNWVTTRDWLAKNHDLAKRFVSTVYDVARWSNKNHDLTAPILAKYSKIDLDRIKTMNRVMYATGFDPKMLQPSLDAAYNFKVLSRRVTADELVTKL